MNYLPTKKKEINEKLLFQNLSDLIAAYILQHILLSLNCIHMVLFFSLFFNIFIENLTRMTKSHGRYLSVPLQNLSYIYIYAYIYIFHTTRSKSTEL